MTSVIYILVPAKDDICTRYPQFSLCLGNGQLAPGGAPPPPPTAPPPVEKQTLDRDSYCKKYQLHFTYFCSPGVDQGPNAQDFCKAYGKNCDVNAAPQAYTKDQITAECSKKKSLAETYCTGNEPDAIRSQCDQYRQYCLNGQPAAAATAAPIQPIFDPVQYCTSYQPAYIQACATPRPPQGIIGRRRKRQGDPAALAAAAGYTPEKISAMCTQYQSLASTYCTGNEPAGQIKDKCNLYRTYCLKQASAPAAPVAPVAPAPAPVAPAAQPSGPQSPDFCPKYVATCSNLQASPQQTQVQYLCANYVYMADTFCPGYETAQSRITCNNYRMYCQNKQPFRDIDGVFPLNNGVANVPNNWGNGLLGTSFG